MIIFKTTLILARLLALLLLGSLVNIHVLVFLFLLLLFFFLLLLFLFLFLFLDNFGHFFNLALLGHGFFNSGRLGRSNSTTRVNKLFTRRNRRNLQSTV